MLYISKTIVRIIFTLCALKRTIVIVTECSDEKSLSYPATNNRCSEEYATVYATEHITENGSGTRALVLRREYGPRYRGLNMAPDWQSLYKGKTFPFVLV